MNTALQGKPLLLVRICALAYLAVVFYVLLQPFDFFWPFRSVANSAQWHGGRGIAFGPSGMLISSKRPTALYRGLESAKGLTIELWLKTGSVHQDGPARIISYSLDPWQRNFTVGQDGHRLIVRLRTTNSDRNGMPSVNVAGVFGEPAVQHIVVTYDFSETRVYVDGQLRSKSPLIRGDFKTWDRRYFLIFGNEASGGRPWNGILYAAVIYGRVLSAHEVADQRTAQSGSAGSPLAAFNFTNSLEGKVKNGGKAAAANLTLGMAMPHRVAQFARAAFLFYDGRLTVSELDTWDLVRNIILFLPFGLFGPAFVDRWTHSSTLSAFWIVSAAAVVSLSCETLQFFEWERTSSVLDVVTNIAGAALGTFIVQKLASYAAVWPRLTLFE